MLQELREAIEGYKGETRGGSGRGHFIPGAMWIIWAAWWHVNTSVCWVRGRIKSKRGHLVPSSSLSSSSAPGPRQVFSHGRARSFSARPWVEGVVPYTSLAEPVVKLALPLLGILGELYYKPVENICWHYLIYKGEFDPETVNLYIHTCLYGSVAVSGLADLLTHSSLLPRSFDKLVHVLAFVTQGMLFAVHLKGSELGIMMHKILVGLLFAYSAAAALELFVVKGDLAATFMRPFLLALCGAWICFTGVVLFPKHVNYFTMTMESMGPDLLWFLKWQMRPHLTMMVIPVYLCFYALLIFACQVLVLWIMCFLVPSGCSWRARLHNARKLLGGDTSDYKAVALSETLD
ncbi:putative transmembrane protein [Chloropicon primus]|uniref:Putative transmembrane protein n=1 Tax=Chloropicon primus TaxID=1764295 RepID=A0A5B8MAX5_9CHLO|nr:putative transmembrane protein [Chloropicon primus]|eukprot:QDZ17487.1 putative transmembrane protein [Chloropicon primus]